MERENNSLFNSSAWQAYSNLPNVSKESIQHNKEVLEKINSNLSKDKISLFIGRDATEELPKEEGVIWVSMDIKENSKPIEANRLHLIMDCNDKKQLAVIKEIFSDIVVDQSTWKFFDKGIIDRLTSLLKFDKTSRLIFESKFQFVAYENLDKWKFNHIALTIPENELLKYYEAKNKAYDNFVIAKGGLENLKSSMEYHEFLKISREKYGERFTTDLSNEELLGEFKQWYTSDIPNPSKSFIPLARQKTLEHLNKLFERVELNLESPFPYKTRYSNGNDDYFQAIGRKHIE
jgi:hypothetical protein